MAILKRVISVVFVMTAMFGCSQKNLESVDARASKVDASLAPAVYFRGEPLGNIKERMEYFGVPGVSVAIIYNNEIVALKAYGIMDKETNDSVTPNTLFQAGSISKPVAAYGALKLVELGKLSLDADVNQYLTSWKVPENDFTAKSKVTLKGIVSHIAGLTVHGFLGYSPDLAVPTTVQVLDGLPPANSPPVRVDKLPGESFRYSGGGYTVMQLMMEDVYGKPFASIEQELVLGPIGMSHSTYAQPLDSVTVKSAATGYLPDHSQTKGKRHTYPEMAAAGLWTTAEDLAKFAIDVQLSISGKRNAVLSKDMATQFVTKVLPDGPTGLGIFINGDAGYVGHGGWDEGFSSQLMFHTTKGYGAAILTNSNHPEFINELMRGIALVYGWEDYLLVYDKQPLQPEKLAPFVGRYQNGPDGVFTISREGDKFFAKYLRGEKNELFRVRDSLFTTAFMDNPFLIRNKDGRGEVVFYSATGPVGKALPAMVENTKVPYEYLLEDDVPNAVKAYQAILKDDPASEAVSERMLNFHGYDRLSEGKVKLARAIFKANMILYPNSSNVYDSYADAVLEDGDKAEAIKYYTKALSMDPKNEELRRKLARLR